MRDVTALYVDQVEASVVRFVFASFVPSVDENGLSVGGPVRAAGLLETAQLSLLAAREVLNAERPPVLEARAAWAAASNGATLVDHHRVYILKNSLPSVVKSIGCTSPMLRCRSLGALWALPFATSTAQASQEPLRSLKNTTSSVPGTQPSRRSFAGCWTRGTSPLPSTANVHMSRMPLSASTVTSYTTYRSSGDKTRVPPNGPRPKSLSRRAAPSRTDTSTT